MPDYMLDTKKKEVNYFCGQRKIYLFVLTVINVCLLINRKPLQYQDVYKRQPENSTFQSCMQNII